LVDTEAEDIVEMDLTHKDILKVFLMFHDWDIIYFFNRNISIVKLGVLMIKYNGE
jgi:hypothetical protein